MAAIRMCLQGTETQIASALTLVEKALGLPSRGVHGGGGVHVPMPDTWDGTGSCPPGWSREAVPRYSKGATDAVAPLPDALATLLQEAAQQARLTPAQRTALNSALGARVNRDLDAYFSPLPLDPP